MSFNPIKESVDGKKAHAVIWSTSVMEKAIKGIEQGKKLVANPFYEKNVKLMKGDLVFEKTEYERSEWLKCRDDIIYFANKYCKLMTPTGIQHITLRDYQEEYLRHLEKNRLSIFLSCRQSAKTTTSAIFMLHYILFNIDKNALVLGNKRKTAVEILTKLKKIFQELPYFLKPGVYKWNEGEINLDNGCMCMAEATTINSGISFTFHCVLADEFAHIHPNILDKFYNNLFPVVTAGKARFIISSTQNGYNLFYRLWCGAVEHENEYMPYKVDWWQVPEWDPDKQCFVKRDEKWHKLQIANYGGEQAFNKQFGTGFDISGNSLISSKALNRLAPRTVEFKRQEMKCRGADYFFWNLESDVTLENLREHYVTMTVDISEADGGDYIVAPINVLRKGIVGQDLESLQGEVKTECIGYFYTNEHGYKWAAERLREFCMTYLYNPVSPKYIISVELNLYGELFVNYMKTIIDRETMTVQFFSEDAFVKYYNDAMTKYEMGARITPSSKQKYCKLFKSDIEDGKIVCCATKFHNELTNFCDQKGNGTYKASFGHDDFVMAQIQLEAVFKTVQWKNFVEDFLADEEKKKMNAERHSGMGSRPGVFTLGDPMGMSMGLQTGGDLYSFGMPGTGISDPYYGMEPAIFDMQHDVDSNLARLTRMR